MRYYNQWNIFLHIEFESFCHISVFSLASHNMFISLNNLTKKVGISDKFDGVNINTAKKYGKFPMPIHSVKNRILLTKCTKQSWLLQYSSHIRKFWFVILLKFPKIPVVRVVIWFQNHESQIVILNPVIYGCDPNKFSPCKPGTVLIHIWWCLHLKLTRLYSNCTPDCTVNKSFNLAENCYRRYFFFILNLLQDALSSPPFLDLLL